MGYVRNKFNEVGFDEATYKRYFHRHQQEYIRKRLRMIQAFAQGESWQRIAEGVGEHPNTVRKYVNGYIKQGFEWLCQPITRQQPTRLKEQQVLDFKKTLLAKRPNEVGLEGNIWTGELMRQYLLKTYNVVYKSGIYDLLERLEMSHQRAHADYGNAKVEDQEAFLRDLQEVLLTADEQTAVVKFDEFSVCEKPSSYYGWAERNTRPVVVTDEKKERA
jgi:transposase